MSFFSKCMALSNKNVSRGTFLLNYESLIPTARKQQPWPAPKEAGSGSTTSGRLLNEKYVQHETK
jgi:hypothetical protein